MMPHDYSDALILTGPTGSGKTAVSLELAEMMNAEIVAMDSMTLYRGMDIGTAKPSKTEQARVRHHLIDVLEPHESANVAWWLQRAADACDDIRRRGKRPLFVGGTPFYLKALLHGLFDSPPIDPFIRKRLEAEAEALGPVAFHAKLAAVDPDAAAKIHPNNVRRVVRALEIHRTTGTAISALQQTWAAPPTPIPAVVLEWPRDVLYERINRRVEEMIAAGWVQECERLLEKNLSKEARQAVGYHQLAEYGLRNRFDVSFFKSKASEDAWHDPRWWKLSATIVEIKLRTRQFAKRQLTWFRSLPVTPVDATRSDLVPQIQTAWASPIQPSEKS